MPEYKSLTQPAAPAAVEPASVQTHVEGEDAFLRDRGGQVVRVPKDLAQRYVVEQGFIPATAEQADKAKTAAETSAAEEFVKEAGGSFVSTIGLGARLPAMIADLAGVEGASDFLRETSTTGIRANMAAAFSALRGDGQKAAADYDESKRRQVIYEELFPTARMLGRTTGEIGGALLLGGPAGAWAGAGKTALGVAGRSALVSGAEGAATGMAEEYRKSALENRAVDRELLISGGIIGGALSAAAGGVLGYGGKKLADALGAKKAASAAAGKVDDAAPTPTRARAVATTERAVAESADELDRPALELEQQMAEAEARVQKAVANAGPNPNAQQAAAEAAAEAEAKRMQDIAGADFDPARWREMKSDKFPAMAAWIHRKAGLQGAATELREHGDTMLRGTSELTDILRDAPLKKEHVAQKLAADGVDETAAIATAQGQQRAFNATLEDLTSRLKSDPLTSKTSAVKVYLGRMQQAQQRAARDLDKADSAADAFIVRDQFRRDMYKLFDGSKKAMQKAPNAAEDDALQSIVPMLDAEYHRAAHSLFDQKTWKSMGEFQQAANGQDGWVGLIDADKVGLRSFASPTTYEYGREVLGFDPDKLLSYLERIDQPTLRDDQIRNVIGKRAMMVRTIRDGLDLTPAQRATADRVLEAAEKSLSALDDAETIAIRLNRQAKLNEAEKLSAQGGVVQRLIVGGLKAMQGDIREGIALQAGGQHLLAQHAQAIRVQAKGQESRMTRLLLKVLDTASGGAGSPNASAIAKIERRARAGGIIDDTAERLATRMRDQNYALAPLFKPAYDREPGQQREVHKARQEVLADLSANPERMQQALETSAARAMAAHPVMGAQIAEETAARIQRLQAALPGVSNASLLPSSPSGRRELVSAQDLREAEAMVEATLDPQSVFEDFSKGRLSYDKLKFAKLQYPEIFTIARAMALDVFRELPGDIRGNMATQLDFLLDFEGQLDPTLSADFLKRQVDRLEEMKGKQAQANAAPRRAPNTGAAAQTYTQRLAGV